MPFKIQAILNPPQLGEIIWSANLIIIDTTGPVVGQTSIQFTPSLSGAPAAKMNAFKTAIAALVLTIDPSYVVGLTDIDVWGGPQ